MKSKKAIAVITPYYKEDISVLRQCHESVMEQEADADHFMIADGFPIAEIDKWNVIHVKLPMSSADYGNTPRGLGSILAKNHDYSIITYLDADNWYHPQHIYSLLEKKRETNSDIITCLRTYHELDGRLLQISEGDENALLHVDTSCILLTRKAFKLIDTWTSMPRILSPIGDRIFYAAIKHGRYSMASTLKRSVAYRTRYEAHYLSADRPSPIGCKTVKDFAPLTRYLNTKDGVSETVGALGFWPPTYAKL